MNGKENLSPQDKNGVEVSDDPLRQCTKLKLSSCISLSLGAIGIISPFSRTSRSPCLCQILSRLHCRLLASPARALSFAGDQHRMLGVRTAVPVSRESPGILLRVFPGPCHSPGASWCPLTPPATAALKDLTHPCTERCAFPSSIPALQKGPGGF